MSTATPETPHGGKPTVPDTLAELRVPIDELTPYDHNPRRGNIDVIAESLAVNGQYRPIVANRRTGQVLAGNHTLQAARSLGWTYIAATWVDVDDEAAARIVAVDNRANDLAGYDNDVLVDLLQSLPDLSGTGYDEAALAELLGGVTELPPALTDPDDAPAAPKHPTTEPGDVWLLGPHRLVCGDSTMLDVWDALCRGEAADLLFTDPPYGMSYGGGRSKSDDTKKHWGVIENDDLIGDNLVALVRDALVATLPHRKPESPAYVCFTWRTYTEFLEALRQADMQPKSCIVWNKGSIGLGQLHYRPQHEFIFYVQGQWYGDKAQSDVWTTGRDSVSGYKHPTQKPVELVQRALENSSKRGDIVLDAFGGSGSTLIACHATGRKARLVELDPRYADVICRRYQEHTGDKPVLQSTGQPHDFTQADG